MLYKLSMRNVRRQVGNYLIYFMTVVFTVAMLFALCNIIFSDNIMVFTQNNSSLKGALIGVVVFISAIVAFVLSYATFFMLKLRKREFGTYLTLGMTRKNILTIFIFETTVICLVALAAGIGLGLLVYQGLTALMMNILEVKFALAAYSPKGLVLTVALVMGIFILASLTSAIFLKRVRIYHLIYGNKSNKKTVQYPLLWFVLTILAFIINVGSIVTFGTELENIITNDSPLTLIFLALLFFALSIIIFHIALAKSLMSVLLRKKSLANKGTNTVVLRQLSCSLSTNSIMIGFLAFLLTFAIIGTNLAFVQKASDEAQLNKHYPYDIAYSQNLNLENDSTEENVGIPVQQAESIIKQYVEIKSQFSFSIYSSLSNEFYSRTQWSGEDYASLTDSFMKLSDFNAFMAPLMLPKVTLDNEYMIIANANQVEGIDWSNFIYEREGVSYSFKSVSSHYPRVTYVYFFVVLPDHAVDNMRKAMNCTVYDTADVVYDAFALKEQLTYKIDREDAMFEMSVCDYILREYGRQQQNSTNAILIVGAFFIAAIFLFMALAMLSLKVLTTLSEDKRRFQILYRLGASAAEQRKTLFRQTFSFFLLPFLLPLLISIPTVLICQNMIKLAGFDMLVWQMPLIGAATAGVMALIYFVYYAATYLIAQKAIIINEK